MSSSARSMRDVIRSILILDVVFGLICPLFAVAPDYEFDLHLYQQNISWLQCPEGWTNFGIKCFKIFTDKASFEESEINCQSYGGHLIHIDRLNKNLLLGERALNEGVQEAAWLGFWREVNGSYHWTNDEFGDKNLAFWVPGQPQILHDDLKLCTYMIINSGTNQYRWVLDRCEVKRGFICEMDACVFGDFRCGSGQCVSPHWRCDGKPDCPDGRDEQNCGTDSCGGFVEGFQITYPNQVAYKPWLNCQWKVRAPIGYKVKLQFTHLDTEPMYDVVGVYDGLTTQTRLIGNFSGQDIPPAVTSTTNFLLVTLTTDHSTERTGFSAKWSSVLSLCDSSLETLEADNEIKWVTSPGYPEYYSDNLQCSWIIRAVREEHVTLKVIDVDLLPGDWLEIRDGASRESTLIHRYSGRVQNDVLVSSGRHFYLHLHTDLKGSGTGFNISYHSGCDVTISGGFGRISSPGFHAGNRYPNNLQCSWTLQDINNRPSTLTFNFFHTEASYDFVQIYNATTISSETLLLNISGSHSMLESLRSPIGHFIVHFQTDNLVNKAGWSASFSFDCHDDTPLPENLSVTSSRAGYQSYITYSCDKGYRLEGTNKRFCDKAGIWNSTVPVCKLINCGVPLPLLNGVLLNVTSRNYDGVGYYRCNPGHGDTDIVYKVTCLDQGWIGMPSCSPMECPKLKAVPNGIIHSPYLYRIHARADFKCHSGYRIKGHMTSECLHGGHWSRPEPICVPINTTLCVEVKVIHGSINQTGPIMVGETIHITCKDGYQLYPAGLDSITCMESGQYDQQIPQCADIDECQSDKTCGSQHTCHNIGGGFWCECTEGYQHTDIEDPLCEDIDECSVNNGNCEQACVNTEGGYQCSCSGVSRLYTGNQTQLINGRLLVPGQSCYVVCENQSIERSERLIYTTTPLPDGSYLYPTSLHIVCPHGAFPDGPPLVTCKQDGTWSADVDKCIVRQCDHLDDLEKGDIVFTSNREAGSFANYTCHQGYSLHGNRSRFCHAMVDYQGDVTLVWTGKQPVCEPVDCHTPPSVRNGNVSYPSTRFKNIAIYSCNHGYKLKDVSYRKCLFSGLWSTDEIICVAQTCPWLQPPLAGSLTSNSTWYGDGAVESFKCNAGYQLSDTSPLLCYIPEPFPDDVASTSLPHLEFDVSFTVYSSEALDKIKQNCSIHYSQELQGRLDGTIKRLIPYSKCAWPSDAGSVITHKDITLNTTNKTTHKVVIKKKVSIYPAHTLLPSPVRGEEDCFSVLDRRDVLYLPNNSVCERTVTSKLEILEPVELVCKNGVPVQQGDVTFCVNIKQGPVFMLIVDFILRTTTPVTNTCSIRLREHVRVGVNNMVNTMRFDEKCPGLNNPVLTNTSGSVQIGDEKIEVKIPFFLHDNTSPFHEVQQCGSAIQEAITSTFKDVIKAMVQQLNVKCTNISFSFADSDFTIPVTQEICQVQYEFDNSSSKCVFCGSCGSLDTTTSTTTSTTTPAPLSSSSSTTTSSTQPASLVTSTTELSTSALTSSVASTDPSPSSSTSETVSTTSDTVSTTSDKVTTTSNRVTTTSDTVSTTIDTVSTTSETVSTTSDKVSTTSDKVSTTSDKVTTTSDTVSTTIDTVSTTIDTVSTTSDKVSTTSEAISTTSDKVSTTSDAISTTTDSSSESTSSTTAEITTSTPSPSSTTISGEQTTSTSPERTSSSTTQATTTPSLAGCSNRTNSVNEVVVSDLDLSVQQTNLLWTSTFQVDNSDQSCIELYENRMKKLISIQEVQINSFLNIKTKCTDEGTYVRYTNLEMTAAGNTVTLKIAASLTRIAGVQFSSVSDGTISKCIGAMVGLPEFSQMKCLCFSSVLKSGSNLCPPVLLTNTMSFTRQIKSCDQGWSYLNNICVQDTPSTTASSSTTALTTTATSSIQTTTTEASPTTTSNGVIEETTMAGMHECYICDLDGASSNAECVNMFESCTMENPVCMTQVTYQGKSGQYTLQKACSAQKDCERERTNTAGLCDRGKTSPYCVYCCNTSKCNLNVELLTFKGRRKRSAEDSIPPLIAQWNNTAPVCKDEERPMFNNCPSGMIVVNDSILPVSVNVQIPTAVDNSGIKPSITISPSNFTTPYWIYHSTNITFTATDGAGLVAECVVIIQVKDMTPPTLNCPRNTLKVYKDITEETVQIDYADITANLSDMVDLNSFQRRSMTPDMTDTVSVLEEFLVTLAVWDHANNSATCSFLMMYIPLGCPLWTLGSPLNVNLTRLSSTTVKAQCKDNSIMVHSGNASAVMEYTCEQHAMWTPTVFTPDCIPADLSVCPEWIYNVSWMVTPDSFMSIQPQCNITGSLTAQIHKVLNTLNVNIDILLIQNSTHNGIITVTSSFKMTSNNLIPAVCPSVRQVQGHLDNLNVSSLCQGSAILTNVTILGIQMDCSSGLALMENNQEGGLCWPCPRGMAAKTAVCELCPIGTYRDNLTSTVCSPCPRNKSTKNNGSMSLSDCKELCPLGWFSPSGLAPCIQCQPGTYQGGTGGKSCSSCKPGFGSSKYGSTSQTECKAQCGENEYSSTGFEPCVSCPYGYYNNQTQSTRCYRCTELTSSFLSCSESCGGFLCGDHGTCITGAQGNRCHCEPTHTGKQCDTPLSLCDEVLCQNGGTCEATNNSFVCSCMPGYNGVLCETKLAACYSSPCLNGLCKLTQDSFICQCYQGYKGRLCDQRENRCVNHKCQHGQCISLLEGYLCNCTGSGYYGEFCDSIEEHCQEGNCLNGGRCVNALNGFSCTCPSDYEGLVCEKKKDLCTESFCLNGGQCVTDIAGQTSCICKSGYSGDTCQTDDQLCQVNPCQNQGTCVRYQDKTTCQCKQGFSGEYCEFPLTIGCEEEPCDHDNSLECLGSDEGVTCICKSGWKGKYCEEIDDLCQSNPCQNGGECENHGAHFTCVCLQGYAGNHCQDDVDECRSDPCMNGGNCTDQPGGYTCKCSPHFYGDTCHREIDGCVSNPCVHGTCLDAIEGYHCLCHHDWTGTQCDEAVNKCLSLPCENGGSCHQNGTEFTCTCQPRYTGMLCESELKPCEPNPCNNGGVCTGMSVAFTCTCPSGYHGDTCDLVVNVCDMVQCEHGGTCVEEDTGGRCVCTSLYTGQHCEKEKSADFDLTVTDEVSVVCETELGLEELTALTLCLTYRAAPTNDGFGYSRGLILKAMDEMNETLLAVSADKLEISFWNDSRPVVVEFGQLGIAWHQICLTWSSLTGRWSVYVDQRLQDQALNYGTERNLSQFKLSTRQPTTPLFQGQITGVNVYRTVLDIGDLDRCTHGNRGDVISWAMFDQCQSEAEGVSVTYPSACPSSHCLPGYMGDQCNTLFDKSPPVVEYCPDDMVNVITVDELRTVVTWNEPVFYDNIAVVQINQTYYSGDVFTYGEYQVIYMAFDAADNHASCLFHVIVTSGHCKIPPHPLNGQRSCDAQGHSFTHCSISCLDPSLYQFTEEPAQLYICREAGVWDPPRGKQFTFPPCAGYSAPSQSYQGIILLKDQTCSESVKLNLIHQLQQQFYQTGLCETEDCQTSSVIVDCVIVNSRKRSTEPVQYKVTFNIPSPSYSIINSTAITDSFEQFVKEGMVNYTVEDFTMEVQLQCASGQVLSADKEFCVNCGKGYYFSSDSRQCELCPLGSFSAAERQMSCTSCDITQSTLTEGSTSQEDCFYICDVGYYLLDGECEPCEVGYYEDRTGSTQCKPCRLGYTTLTNASTHSSQCYFPCDMIGYTMSPEGSCVPCPRGWYKAERFDVACRPCPTGFTTLDVGAGSENLCTLVVCSPGYWRNDENKCDPCPIGTYQNDPGQDFCHRCPPGYTTSETGVQSLEACIRGEVDECLLQTDDCPDKSVCKDTEESFECQCILGYTKMQDGSCIDNCLDVCIHGDCEYDSAGNPVCKCHDDYQGLKCDDEAGGLSAGSIIGISVAVLFAVVLLAFLVFVCLRQKSSVKGTERQLLRFPIHRSDLRSSFRAIALAMNPFESSTERTVSTVLKGNRRKSKMSNTNTSGNFSNKSSSPSKTSYF